MMRIGLFKAVYVKTSASQHRRQLLTSRRRVRTVRKSMIAKDAYRAVYAGGRERIVLTR